MNKLIKKNQTPFFFKVLQQARLFTQEKLLNVSKHSKLCDILTYTNLIPH